MAENWNDANDCFDIAGEGAPVPEGWPSILQVSRRYGVAYQSLYRFVGEGRLRVWKGYPGKGSYKWFIDPDSLAALVAARNWDTKAPFAKTGRPPKEGGGLPVHEAISHEA